MSSYGPNPPDLPPRRPRQGPPRRDSVRWGRIVPALIGLAVVAVAAAIVLVNASGGGGRGAGPPARAGRRATRAAPGADSAAARRRRGRAESAETRKLVALGLPIYCAAPHGDMVALTFDDGPGPYTALAIRKLRRHGLRATFFVVGRNLPLVPGITHKERALGAVGDHTFTHPLLTQLAPAAAEQEITRTQTDLEKASGGPVTLFRPPYGGRNPTIDRIASRHGMVEILWTVDSADSLGANYAGISRNVIAGLRPGAIILMHENRGQTIRALLSIFGALQRRHLRAVSVPQLLTEDPPSVAQVRAGGRGCGGSRAPSAGGG
jgi:peptidoglycan/xylan/chitin deacetylase (PgdA/CDA1 family)